MKKIHWTPEQRAHFESLLVEETAKGYDTKAELAKAAMARMPENLRRPVNSLIISQIPINKPEFRAKVKNSSAIHEPPTAIPVQTTVREVAEPDVQEQTIDWLAGVVAGVLRHPEVVRGLHGLISSMFEKEERAAVDKTALWSEATLASKLPRIAVVGADPGWYDELTREFGGSIALRFWSETSDSRGRLKQLLYKSERAVVVWHRLSHASFNLVKARASGITYVGNRNVKDELKSALVACVVKTEVQSQH